MARNANMDKAKRQAVGIYRAASPNAKINHGTTEYSGGDYRLPEAAKTCYLNTPSSSDAALVAAFQGAITQCPAFTNSSGRKVRPNDLNRRRAGCDPRTRSELIPGEPVRAGVRYFTNPVTSSRLIPAKG